METELRPMAGKRYHRIIVNVTDDEIADNMLGNAMNTMLRPIKNKFGGATAFGRVPSKNISADIDVLNCTTLCLNQKDQNNPIETRTNQIMFFDCVGRTESDPLVRYELGSLFDLLLIDRKNCCLANFKPIRERPTNFFNNVLVPEVDKRLIMLQGTMTLRSIKLEYYDVQKYDVVNMCDSAKGPLRKLNNQELIFQNTRELLRWTQRSFLSLWVYGSEHDCFDLEFTFNEAPNEVDRTGNSTTVNVKLSILQFYLNKMDGDLRVGLRNFLENVNQTELRMKHSIITDYLREYFYNEIDSWQIWMLFDVPSVNLGSSLANDMLALASAAYLGVHSTNVVLKNSDMDLLYNRDRRRNETTKLTRQTAGQYSTHTIASAASSPTRPPTPTPTPTAATTNQKAKCTTLPTNCTETKFGNYSLSFWYCRIEESFANVITSLERYYDRKYELKVKRMCGELKRMTRNQSTLDDSDIEADETLKNYFRQYRDALSAYRVLIQKIERTRYAEQLNVFVKAKNNEIAKQTRQMKVRLLELCQTRLSNAIRDEVKTLNTEKELISKLSNELIKTVKNT